MQQAKRSPQVIQEPPPVPGTSIAHAVSHLYKVIERAGEVRGAVAGLADVVGGRPDNPSPMKEPGPIVGLAGELADLVCRAEDEIEAISSHLARLVAAIVAT